MMDKKEDSLRRTQRRKDRKHSLILICFLLSNLQIFAQNDTLPLPKLQEAPTIDGSLEEWKEYAYHDGLWDIYRLSTSPWYTAARNRLTQHGETASLLGDLKARYYTAWDDEYLYLGAEVWDNRLDTSSHRDGPHRWYDKDGVSWFFEAPGDEIDERFAQGDNAYCFIADPRKPKSGAWWRHGAPGKTYIEEPIPEEAVEYEVILNPWDRSEADFILEARVHMASTMKISDPTWTPPEIGHIYRLMIVHCDPDGGPYGGHFLMYGKDDDDLGWHPVKLVGPIKPPKRKEK